MGSHPDTETDEQDHEHRQDRLPILGFGAGDAIHDAQPEVIVSPQEQNADQHRLEDEQPGEEAAHQRDPHLLVVLVDLTHQPIPSERQRQHPEYADEVPDVPHPVVVDAFLLALGHEILQPGIGAADEAPQHDVGDQPVNVHRLIANVVLGGFICGAYAGLKYLMAADQDERVHYDWMGYVGNFIGVFGMLPLPFAGYWLMREVYQYNQQMGITLMGGFLSWLFILQAMLIGILFLGANYYFWLGIMYRIPGSEAKYRKPILTMLVILLICLGVWMTPHSLVASLEEARKMGGTHHPMLGVLGVMSAKMTVVNVMILVTFMSFVMYWRAGKQETATWAKAAKVGQGVILGIATVVILVLGVWGYFVPAITRINYFSTTQVLVMLFVLLTITPLTALVLKSAKTTTEMVWGIMPPRAAYALVLNAVMVILLMTLMGYARSSSRVHWHVYGVMQDTSPYAYSPALGYAAAFMSLNTFLFCLMVAFIFWVASLGGEKKEGTPGKAHVKEAVKPAVAGAPAPAAGRR